MSPVVPAQVVDERLTIVSNVHCRATHDVLAAADVYPAAQATHGVLKSQSSSYCPLAQSLQTACSSKKCPTVQLNSWVTSHCSPDGTRVAVSAWYTRELVRMSIVWPLVASTAIMFIAAAVDVSGAFR